MQLTIIGAAGRTGRQLALAALDAGHTVTAAARDSTKLEIHHQHLRTATTDVQDPASLDGAIEGSDGVASTIGGPAGNQPTQLYSTARRISCKPCGTPTSRVSSASAPCR